MTGAVAQPGEPMPGPDIDAFYRLVAARRDMRNGFKPDPVSDEVLTRVLTAAHQAPSVGLSQPWDFIIVRDRAVRRAPPRGGGPALAPHAQPQVAAYSSVCAVQNLWLAARAEGLGVGWVS